MTRATPERIALVPVVLSYPAWVSVTDIAAELGTTRWFVSSVRLGLRYRDVHPELPRPGNQAKLRCSGCVQWVPPAGEARGRCQLGIPEAKDQFFARGCGAFHAAS